MKTHERSVKKNGRVNGKSNGSVAFSAVIRSSRNGVSVWKRLDFFRLLLCDVVVVVFHCVTINASPNTSAFYIISLTRWQSIFFCKRKSVIVALIWKCVDEKLFGMRLCVLKMNAKSGFQPMFAHYTHDFGLLFFFSNARHRFFVGCVKCSVFIRHRSQWMLKTAPN